MLRGAWVLEVITGTPPHAPPPAIPALKENVPGAQPLTIRQRMEMHRSQPSCNACHGIMDPIGMSLENFDAMGKWQNKDAETGTLIDTAGKMADGTADNGPDDLRKALAARPDQFVQTLTVNLMTYALGRTVEYFDMPVVRGSCATRIATAIGWPRLSWASSPAPNPDAAAAAKRQQPGRQDGEQCAGAAVRGL